jgi:cytochrome c
MKGRVVLAGAGMLATFASAAWANEELADKHACLNCHQVQKKLVGPSFKAIADKYRGQADAAPKLVAKLAQGGTGVWGAVPMPAMPQVPADDAKRLVDWVLQLP